MISYTVANIYFPESELSGEAQKFVTYRSDRLEVLTKMYEVAEGSLQYGGNLLEINFGPIALAAKHIRDLRYGNCRIIANNLVHWITGIEVPRGNLEHHVHIVTFVDETIDVFEFEQFVADGNPIAVLTSKLGRSVLSHA